MFLMFKNWNKIVIVFYSIQILIKYEYENINIKLNFIPIFQLLNLLRGLFKIQWPTAC